MLKLVTRKDYWLRQVKDRELFEVIFKPTGSIIHGGLLDRTGAEYQINYDAGERNNQPWWYRAIGQLDESGNWIRSADAQDEPVVAALPTDADADEYVRVNTPEMFNAWCVEAGWESAEDFADATGVSFEEIQGHRFLVVHNRVFIEYEGPSRGEQ